ncbi:hypothetical protein GCM10020331_003350 [Ectobacillus funiculus]
MFRKDKLVGWLNHQEGRGLLWLRNELKTSLITINIPKEKKGVGTLVFESLNLRQNESLHFKMGKSI